MNLKKSCKKFLHYRVKVVIIITKFDKGELSYGV